MDSIHTRGSGSSSSASTTSEDLKKVAVVVFIFSHVLSLSSAAPKDWVSGSPFSQFTSDDSRADIFTSAYLNISMETEDGSWKWDKTEGGRFGGGFVGPSAGVIIHVSSKTQPDDHTGCQLPFYSTRPDRKLPPPGEPWIALIKRGRCNFEVKVENAFRSNAAGVLVYNDRNSATLDKMKLSSDSGRNISGVFIYKWKGEELAKSAENNSKIFVHITIAGQMSLRTANINRTSVLFVSITFIVLMIISLASLVFYYVQRSRYIHAKDRLSVSPTELENLLIEMPGVADVAIVGISDDLAGQVPKAFIVKQPNSTISEDDVLKFINPKVVHYKKLSGGVKFVEAIPRNPSGKILRNELKLARD